MLKLTYHTIEFPLRSHFTMHNLTMTRRRGNIFSRAHIALSPSEPAFWDFSWDEMAAGDLPALTDYVLAATGHRKLGYVGRLLRLICVVCLSAWLSVTVLLSMLHSRVCPQRDQLIVQGQLHTRVTSLRLASLVSCTCELRCLGRNAAGVNVPRLSCCIAAAGHSQGTTMALAAFAGDPGLAVRFTAAALLAPVAFLQHLQSPPLKALAALDTDTASPCRLWRHGIRVPSLNHITRRCSRCPLCWLLNVRRLQAGPSTGPYTCLPAAGPSKVRACLSAASACPQVFDDLGLMELLAGDPDTAAVFSAVCEAQPARCLSIIDAICGANPANLNATRLPLYLQYTPAGGLLFFPTWQTC